MENPDAPENSKPDQDAAASGDGSLQDWIERAKRTHELVDAVDLDKITAHDATEKAKLAKVQDALSELSAGHDVEHVEGVDEVNADVDPKLARKAALLEELAALDCNDRISRVLCVNEQDTSYKPMELIPHHEGLPEFDVCLAPIHASGQGNFGLFISHAGLFAATIAEPPSKHHWRIVRSCPYDNMEELRQSIAQYSQNIFETS